MVEVGAEDNALALVGRAKVAAVEIEEGEDNVGQASTEATDKAISRKRYSATIVKCWRPEKNFENLDRGDIELFILYSRERGKTYAHELRG